MRQRVSGLAGWRVSVAKWIGKWLLQIPVYLVTANLMQTLIGSCYRLALRSGAQLPPNILLDHMLVVALAAGFLAGLVGLLVFRAMLLLPSRPQILIEPKWKRPQAWTWVLAGCWFVFGVMTWFRHHALHSVLATSGGANFSNLIAAFFGNGCYLARAFSDQEVLQTCMTQLTYTCPLVGSLGYSAAAFVPSDWLVRLRQKGETLNDADPVIEQTEQDDKGQIAHT